MPEIGKNQYSSKALFRSVGESEKKKRFEVSFSSETPCDSWGGKEILLHTSDAVKLDRLREVGTVLFAHGRDSNYGRMPVARLENIKLDEANHRCIAEIVMDDKDEKAMALANKMERGFINGISVGAEVKRWIRLAENEVSADGRFTGPCYLACEWEPFEISIVATPADPSVGVDREINETDKEDKIMPGMTEKNVNTTSPATATSTVASAASINRETVTVPQSNDSLEGSVVKERERVLAITRTCSTFGVDPAPYIEKGVDIGAVNADVLRQLGERYSPVSGLSVVRDEKDKYREAAVDSVLLRGGIRLEKAADGANDLRGMTLRDLAIETLTREGKGDARRMTSDSLFRAALSPDSAFAAILSNAVDKTMRTEYAVAPSTFERFTSKSSYVDFKPKEMFQISEAGELEKVTQNGEIKFDEMGDSKVTGRLVSFAKSFGFTRQSLINDDIGILTKVPAAYVRAAKRGINKAVYRLITANPTMEDGSVLFSAAHRNLGTAAVPGIASYNEAFSLMMHQKNLRGKETLNIPPRFLLCDPIQYAAHATILHSTANPSSGNSGTFNPFQNMMELIMDSELQAESGAQPYYFVADPAACCGIDVGYLNGNEQPQLDYQVGFDFMGIKYRILIDYAVTLVDHRAFVKNAGSNN